MKIQYLSYNKKNIEGFTCNEINNPQAFDSFDVNIISLDDDNIWCSKSSQGVPLNIDKDLANLYQIITSTQSKTCTIFLLPQERKINYNFSYGKYYNSENLRLCLNSLFSKNLNSINASHYGFSFENNVTEINGFPIKSSFYFSTVASSKIITKSKDSSRPTTIYNPNNGVYYTSLKLGNYKEILEFISYLELKNGKTVVPTWLNDYMFFDDEELTNKKDVNDKKIKELKDENKELEASLNKNMFYKKSLIVNGDELVVIVYKILEELLFLDLSDFIDEKHEDFNFLVDDTRIIGEIKGVTSNVKNVHISQVDEHVSIHKDKLEEKGIEEKVKPLLIINHQRDIPISERESINKTQENKAIREDVLIIETWVLLKLLEKFRNLEITKENIIEMFTKRTGVLKI